VTQATGTLTFGQLYTFLPAKQTLLCSILLFEIGSVLSASAQSFPILVLGRAISGLGGGGLVVGMHTLVGQVIRLQDRTIYYASLGVVFTAASVGGPTLGGVLTTKLSWRWCFWVGFSFRSFALFVLTSSRFPQINLPFGAIVRSPLQWAHPPTHPHTALTLSLCPSFTGRHCDLFRTTRIRSPTSTKTTRETYMATMGLH
jgi:MFS family permease